MTRILPQRRSAVANRAHPINKTLARAIVRPIQRRRAHSGLIRNTLSAIGIAAIAACVVHVAIADPLGRTLYTIERASIEYCGQC